MADSKKYNGSTWLHSLRKLGTATDTITTLPADLYADGNNATVGLVGNMSQTGTPTPQNPIQPSETGERTGNLFDYRTMEGTIKGYYLDSNGDLQESPFAAVTDYIPCSGGKFCLAKVGGVSASICLYDNNKYFLYGQAYNTSSGSDKQTIVVNSSVNASYIRFTYFYTAAPQDDLSTIMLNAGSTALPYEPYGIKIPISSASTTTPVYLGEVQSTRRIKKLVLKGSVDENITLYTIATGNLFRIELPSLRLLAQFEGNGMCTHYRSVFRSADRINGTISGGNVAAVQGVVDIVDDYDTVEDFKAYLAAQYASGTPVCVWYVLATEETATVNEPLRKIGDYADTVSGITIPTITGKDTFDVLTTLKPSEVSLAYTGWHDASVGEWDGSEWQ